MAFGDPDYTSFDDGGGRPEDYGLNQSDFDFASAMGRTSATGGTDAERQAIANYLSQPQVGRSRSNIRESANYDPEFAAALKISRGLNPGGIESLIKTPTYLQPQLTGERLDARGEPVRYYSPVERYLQETAPRQIQQLQEVTPTGILQNLIEFGTKKFNETFRDDKQEEKSDAGIMETIDRADLPDTTKAMLAGMQNTNRDLPPATQTAFNFRDFVTNPGTIAKGLQTVQPFLQQLAPDNVRVITDPFIDSGGEISPQIKFEMDLQDLGLGGLFRNLG
tara:strand:+ start:702 stop:1538 length:837 start_codon:yes stop_codon:yes gene_type:complete